MHLPDFLNILPIIFLRSHSVPVHWSDCQFFCYNNLNRNFISRYIINPAFRFFYLISQFCFQVVHQFSWIFSCYQSNRKFFYRNAVHLTGIGFVKTGIPIHLIKIVNTQIIQGTFIFHDIMLSENPPDILSDHPTLVLFDDQNIDFFWFGPQLMFILKNQTLHTWNQMNVRKICFYPFYHIFLKITLPFS